MDPVRSSSTDPNAEAALAEIGARVRAAFAGPDPFHGPAHARDVEATVVAICAEPDIDVSPDDRFTLRAAALLHDVGYAAYMPDWSPDRREHVGAGLIFAADALPPLPIFAAHPDLVDSVLYLIAYHDDTNYAYPSRTLDGYVAPVALGAQGERVRAFAAALPDAAHQRLRGLLGILREADALAATDTRGAQRTFDYSVARGLPTFSTGNPLDAWGWEESAVGNTRVAAKRMLIDAVSARGRKQAGSYYAAVEAFVANVCAEHGVDYAPETARLEIAGAPTDESFRLTRYLGWDALESALRDVSVIGDRTLHPYAHARIEARRVAIDSLRPMAYYALNDKLGRHRDLQTALERRYALSLFDLTGIIDYGWSGTDADLAPPQTGVSYRMAPPLVEIYDEPGEGSIRALVDGMHRVLLARALGVDSLWVIEISDLPPTLPLVPLPLSWADVELCDDVPPLHAKRKFRFPTRADFPDLSMISAVEITDRNFMYFFYRDLSFLGSEGIRPAGETPK